MDDDVTDKIEFLGSLFAKQQKSLKQNDYNYANLDKVLILGFCFCAKCWYDATEIKIFACHNCLKVPRSK